jgi:Tol biopolymer transport system component
MRAPRPGVLRTLGVALASLAAGFVIACGQTPVGSGTTASDGLVFIRFENGSTEVMRARIADGAVQAVTATPGRKERWPYWSDGAQRVVFQIGDPDRVGSSDLALWDPKTRGETPFPATPQRQERWPAWSPDGRSLVYAFRGGRPKSGVALADLRERATRVIARSGKDDFFLRPNFSPDGRLLVTQRRIRASRGSNLWILSASAPPRRLTDDPDWYDSKAWFTRDGSRIVYTRRPDRGGQSDIVSVAAAGGDLRTLVGTEANEHSARPSLTRDEIAFVSDRDGSSDVFLADLDGGNPRSLRTTPDRNELAPRWSPDGERIAVTTVPEEAGDFGSMNAAAVAQARLVVLDRQGNTLLDTPGAMPDWMPPWP